VDFCLLPYDVVYSRCQLEHVNIAYDGLLEFFLNSTNEDLSEFNLKWGTKGISADVAYELNIK
jgi:hypothetical protein